VAQKKISVLGSDLALTRFVGTASSVPLEVADSWGSLDLSVVAGQADGLPQRREARDLGTTSDRANLAQALVVRLLTPRGALAHLGHAQFGCRLVELIGRLNNETTRNLARLYTLEALSEEPRVRETLGLVVRTHPDRPDVVRVDFSVLPLGDAEPLSLSLEVAL
jgi:phage baseplate assembly protein W